MEKKKFYALAVEDEGALHLIDVGEGHLHFANRFSSIKNARKCRKEQDRPEAYIVRIQVVE